jgi:hypothetical protein
MTMATKKPDHVPLRASAAARRGIGAPRPAASPKLPKTEGAPVQKGRVHRAKSLYLIAGQRGQR